MEITSSLLDARRSKRILRDESNQSISLCNAIVRCWTACHFFYFDSSSTFCIKTEFFPRWLPKFQTPLRLGDSRSSGSSKTKVSRPPQYSFLSVFKCLFMCVCKVLEVYIGKVQEGNIQILHLQTICDQ